MVVVSMVSLAGTLLFLTASNLMSSQPESDFSSDGFDMSPQGERDAYDAADSFALGNTEYANGRLRQAKLQFLDTVRILPTHSVSAGIVLINRHLCNFPVHTQSLSLYSVRLGESRERSG